MNDPEQIGRILAWAIVLAALLALAFLFANRANPPERERHPHYNLVTHEVRR